MTGDIGGPYPSTPVSMAGTSPQLAQSEVPQVQVAELGILSCEAA